MLDPRASARVAKSSSVSQSSFQRTINQILQNSTTSLSKDHKQRKLQEKIDSILHRLRMSTIEKMGDSGKGEDFLDFGDEEKNETMDRLCTVGIALLEQAELLLETQKAKEREKLDGFGDDWEEIEAVCEGLRVKSCKAYELAISLCNSTNQKKSNLSLIYYNLAIAIGDRARMLELKRPSEAMKLWSEAASKYELAREKGEDERVEPIAIARALNNHGLALRQVAMLNSSTNVGSNNVKEKCLKEARDKFRRAIRLVPDFHRAVYNLGTVEYELKNFENAAIYVFSALAMVISDDDDNDDENNDPAQDVYSQSARLVEHSLPDALCGDDSIFSGNVWFSGQKTTTTTTTDFDWARRKFCVSASEFKTVSSAKTFRIKNEHGDFIPSQNDAWAMSEAEKLDNFNVSIPMLSIERCEPTNDISRPPKCHSFLLSTNRDDNTIFFAFACETAVLRDAFVDAIQLLSKLARNGKTGRLELALRSFASKRKKRVNFAPLD